MRIESAFKLLNKGNLIYRESWKDTEQFIFHPTGFTFCEDENEFSLFCMTKRSPDESIFMHTSKGVTYFKITNESFFANDWKAKSAEYLYKEGRESILEYNKLKFCK